MEYFDVFDDNRTLTKKKFERGSKLEKNENRMVAHICIFESSGRMLIQQRQPIKKDWPNKWDISCGGSSISGETSKETAHRELFEELGIDYDFSNERPFLTINFENGFDDFYFINLDIDSSKLKLQDEEVQNVKWATKEEILKLRKNGKFIPYYESFLSMLFEIKKQRGAIDC